MFFQLAFPPVETAQIQTPQGQSLTCYNTFVTLDGGVSNAIDPVWTNQQGQLFGNSAVITTVSPGRYTFTIGAPGCRLEYTVLIKENTQAPQVSASGGILDAAHPTIKLLGHSITYPVLYWWTGPNGFTSTQAQPLVSFPGEYTLTVTNPGNGCSNSITVTVTQE